MKSLSDLELMRRVQAGELRCAGELYERYKQELLNYFYRCTQDYSRSEDLLQNVFIKIIRNKHQFKGDGQFNYWLFRIARNTWIDAYKKKDPLFRAKEIDTLDRDSSVSLQANHLLTQEDQKKRLSRALDQIAPEKKDAIILSRYHGMDYKTIADLSDCSESAIKSRVMRGIAELKELVKTPN